MLVTLDKAADILAQQKHMISMTTDGKVALVPTDKVDLRLTSMDAINYGFYIVKGANSVDEIKAQLEAAAAKQISATEKLQQRQQNYRELRGGN